MKQAKILAKALRGILAFETLSNPVKRQYLD